MLKIIKRITICLLVSLLVIVLVISILFGIQQFIAHGKIPIYYENSPYNNAQVTIWAEAKEIFAFIYFGDYEVVVKEGFWGKTLLKEEFEFIEYKSGLADDNITINWHENCVEIEIENYEINRYDKEFVCYF